MERLTYKDSAGRWVIACNRFWHWFENKLPAHIRGEAVDCLAAYEDTGLEPEEIPTGLELANVYAAMLLLKQYQGIGTVDEFRDLKGEPHD